MRTPLLLLLAASGALATNVNWVGNDNDKDTTAIPLSASYRESLRKLCSKLKAGYKLVPNEKEVRKMCNKLDQDDNNISLASNFNNPIAILLNNKRLIFLSLTVSTIIYFFMNSKNSVTYIVKNVIGNLMKGSFVLKSSRSGGISDAAEGGEGPTYVRMMRLRALSQKAEVAMTVPAPVNS